VIALLLLAMPTVHGSPWYWQITPDRWELLSFLDQFFIWLFHVNTMLIAFNLLPAFPMDGGRVFRGMLTMALGRLPATQIAATLGVVMAGFFMFSGMGFLSWTGLPFLQVNPFLVVVALVVFLSGQQELLALRMLAYRQELEEQGLYVNPHENGGMFQLVIDRSAYPTEPDFSGFTWDRRAGAWIEWREGKPVHVCWPS
jgi:hypothetical protein